MQVGSDIVVGTAALHNARAFRRKRHNETTGDDDANNNAYDYSRRTLHAIATKRGLR